MSTHDVPGARTLNRDVLAMGCWAEHDDGSMIFVEGVEGGTVVYCLFDLEPDPHVQYRSAMPEAGFKAQFSWRPDGTDDDDNIRWTWHDKTPMPWERVMSNFPAGQSETTAQGTMTAAARIARSLKLKAGVVETTRPATTILGRLSDALERLRK